jgi:uncharacterized protein
MDAVACPRGPCSNGSGAFLALSSGVGSSTTVEKLVEPVIPSLVAANPKKKRNVGRAARRRRRKWNEIQHQATAQDDDTKGQSSTNGGGGAENSARWTAEPPIVALVLPMDRSRAVPAVAELRLSFHWTSADEKLLHAQLGYVPGNAIRIAARVSDVVMDCGRNLQTTDTTVQLLQLLPLAISGSNSDDPVVVQLYPLVCRSPHAGGKAGGLRFKARKRKWCHEKHGDNNQANAETSNVSQHTNNEMAVHRDPVDAEDQDQPIPLSREADATESLVIEPFPTIYWLTHPLLSSWISQLERDGYGTQWECRLAANPDALASMQRAHAAYGQERLSLLTDSDVQYMRHRQWDSALAVSRGVAGSTNHGAVKCLHAHTAHYLSGSASCTDNVIGQWVLETLRAVHSYNDLQPPLVTMDREHAAQEDTTDDAVRDR